MSRTTILLTIEHVLAVHSRMIEHFGGDPGIRDEGLLASAVAMPAARFGGKWLHGGIAPQAAAYLFHLCKNHAFVDGNKQTALAAAEVFVRLNARKLAASDEQLEQLTIGVADGTISKAETIKFFRAHVGK